MILENKNKAICVVPHDLPDPPNPQLTEEQRMTDIFQVALMTLERSFVFGDIVEGRAPPVRYKVNGKPYTIGYYLVDGIYPSWSTLVKTIPAPQGNKHKHFAKKQEGARKDVERAFRVLQAHEHDKHDIDNSYDRVDEIPSIWTSFERTPTLIEFIENRHRIHNTQMHSQLQEDLVEHLWKIHGGQ
ncbi:hypothetical protein OSB04_017058 [Centaurea solstitialis]|uniref:Uncharacterized protein n=1 Tax=Centaurea solstitialis TaxID=347529 RepID=A0AA38TM82_9ASTR|nr:hypothetical protein OSB04_017058 [Centaurea solstitialis]